MRHSLNTALMKEVFGDFTPYLNEEGTPNIFWEEEILTSINLPNPLPLAWNTLIKVNKIRCHKLIAPFLSNALTDIAGKVDVWETINDFGGVYQFRVQRRATKVLSKHCWGTAIDLDVCDNPFGREPKVHPVIVDIFSAYGFLWGGHFKIGRKDGMHFEFADISKL